MAKYNANKTRHGKKSRAKKVVKSARKSRKVRKSRKNAIFGGDFFNNSNKNIGTGLDMVKRVLGENNINYIKQYNYRDQVYTAKQGPTDLMKTILTGMHNKINVDNIGIASYKYYSRQGVKGIYGPGAKTIGPMLDENPKHSIFGQLGTNITDDKDHKDFKKRLVVLLSLLVVSSSKDNNLMGQFKNYEEAYVDGYVKDKLSMPSRWDDIIDNKNVTVIGNKARKLFRTALRDVLIQEYKDVKEFVRNNLKCKEEKCNYWVVYNYKNGIMGTGGTDLRSELKEGETITPLQDHLKDKPFFMFEFHQGSTFKSLTGDKPGFDFTSRSNITPLTIDNYKESKMWDRYHPRLTF